ncbi:MAG TPA: hypothetical protein VGR53_04605 [Nitrososphaerales archaeon]|nr:hypothetical protein [Nitrososphaerales archaeon]
MEIIDALKKEIVQVFQLTDPEFQVHLKSDQGRDEGLGRRLDQRPHATERKERYSYVARIKLEL